MPNDIWYLEFGVRCRWIIWMIFWWGVKICNCKSVTKGCMFFFNILSFKYINIQCKKCMSSKTVGKLFIINPSQPNNQSSSTLAKVRTQIHGSRFHSLRGHGGESENQNHTNWFNIFQSKYFFWHTWLPSYLQNIFS